MVQHNAARFIANIYSKKGEFRPVSVTKLLSNLNLESFEERRDKARLIMAYKIINNKIILGPEYLPKTIEQTKRPSRKCNMSTVVPEYHLVEPISQLKVSKSTFFYATPKLWNDNVSQKHAKAPSVDSFKKYFEK